MKAIVHEGKTGIEGISYRDMSALEPRAGEVRVKLKTAGLNHRDLFVLNYHKPNESPLIIGSDGAGVISAIGNGVLTVQVGDEVIINPGLGWRERSDSPPKGFEVLGFPSDGTFAEQVVVPAENVAQKPKHLTWEEAGVLSLAGLTAYRALFTRGGVHSGMKVLIPGIGSGVSTLLLQFAKAVGAKVFVTSRSKDKCKKALELGADKAIDTSDDWNKAFGKEKMDLVIDSIGTATFNKSLDQLRKGGSVVTFGASSGEDAQINIRKFFQGQYNLLGSSMGSTEEYNEMIDLIQTHQIRPILDEMYPLSQFQQAFSRMQAAAQLGKIGFIID
ncbi:zinc-binding dehydrogenase [Ammoniphilus sp. 3BR4]|uniref:zinc-binding dehydrogenase n=1 Tax=Ammoniphilus sp. 3BR4 TaxID=3158265 RepID=UPI003464EA39